MNGNQRERREQQAGSHFDYIASRYGKRFHRGQEVLALGEPGKVTDADHYVHVRLDRLKHSKPYHPDDVQPKVTP